MNYTSKNKKKLENVVLLGKDQNYSKGRIGDISEMPVLPGLTLCHGGSGVCMWCTVG